MHDPRSKGKFEESAVRVKAQTPCSAATRYDLHSFYTQQSLPSEAMGRISGCRHFHQHFLPFELRHIRAERSASVSSALEDLAGSFCSRGEGENGGGRSQDRRITGFSEPLFKVTADALDSLNLVIRHETLFPTARRHKLRKHM